MKNHAKMKKYDLIIIGAGPAGISLAMEARTAGLDKDKILMIDKAESHSWVIRSMYPEKKMVTANYKGQKAVCHGVLCMQDSTKEQAVLFLDRAIAQTGVKVNYKEEVSKVLFKGTPEQPLFDVITNKDTYEAKVVVVAIGIFGRPRKPDYPIPSTVKDRVHFDITSFYTQDEHILVVGGGDSAAEFAQFLIERGNRVTISYRRDSFIRMNTFNRQSIEELLQCDKHPLDVLFNSDIEKIAAGHPGGVEVHFKNNLPVRTYDRIVYALGGSTPENFLKLIGIEFNDGKPLINDKGESNIPGLYIGGDLLAGKKGGSIAHAFNASKFTMENICSVYLGCGKQ